MQLTSVVGGCVLAMLLGFKASGEICGDCHYGFYSENPDGGEWVFYYNEDLSSDGECEGTEPPCPMVDGCTHYLTFQYTNHSGGDVSVDVQYPTIPFSVGGVVGDDETITLNVTAKTACGVPIEILTMDAEGEQMGDFALSICTNCLLDF